MERLVASFCIACGTALFSEPVQAAEPARAAEVTSGRSAELTPARVVELTPERATELTPAPLTLFINQDEKMVTTALLAENDVLVLVSDLESSGLVRVPATAARTIDGKRYVSLAPLTPRLRYEVDEEELALRIVAPAEYFGTTIINFGRVPPEDMVQYRDAGFFLNYAPRLVDFRTPAVDAEAGLSVAGHLLYSGAAYNQSSGVVRGLSNLTIDEPAERRRWVIGDSLVTAGDPLAGSLLLGGLSVGRAFNLDPHFIAVPTLTTSGTALTASTLEVYVNGVLVRTAPIQPGQFRVENVTVPPGVGTTRYVLRDAFGREQRTIAPHYGSQGALARGVTDYGFAVGFARDAFGMRSWRYGGLAMAARYRAGVSDNVTLGARLEAPLDPVDFGVSTGSSLTLLTSAGQFDLGAAASNGASGKNGAAGSASYIYQTSYFAAGIGARSMSEHYFMLGTTPFDEQPRFGGSAFVSVPVGARVVLNSSYSVMLSELGTTASVGANSSVSLTKDMHLDLTASRTRYPDGTAPYEVFGTLSIALGAGVFASTSGQVRGSEMAATLDVSKPAPAGAGLGYRAALTKSEHLAYTGMLQGQMQYGEARINLAGVDKELHHEVGLAGGIVVVPRAGVFFTRPVQDGYAVIQVPGVGDVRGYLNGNEVGRTDGSGDLLVPNLLPYYENRLGVSDEDLPPDYLIEGGNQIAGAPYRGPAVVRFDAKRARFVRGILVVRRGKKKVIPSYGEVTVQVQDRTVTSPIAREGQFEFEALSPGSYRARVEYGEGDCNFSLVVPAQEGAVSELGTVACVSR